MKLLVAFQHSLDSSINMLASRQLAFTFSNLKRNVEAETKRQLSLSHFQQIIKVAPFLYNHKWEFKQLGKQELVINMPKNMTDILKDQIIPASEEAHNGFITGSIM